MLLANADQSLSVPSANEVHYRVREQQKAILMSDREASTALMMLRVEYARSISAVENRQGSKGFGAYAKTTGARATISMNA